MTAVLAHHGLLMGAGAAGASCPDYSTVTLSLTAISYTPPVGDAVLTQLNCPYTPPTVV